LDDDAITVEQFGGFDVDTSSEDDALVGEQSLDDLDIGITSIEDEAPIDDVEIDAAEEVGTEQPAQDDFDKILDDEEIFKQLIPEGFEAGIEETSVPFDDDMLGVTVDGLDEELDIPGEMQAVEDEADVVSVDKQNDNVQIPSELKTELKNILSYMDQILESLPEEKFEELAKSEYFGSYKKLFNRLGLV
jgi:hypothetical protein